MEEVILAFEAEKNARHIREVIESAGLAQCLVCRSAAEVKRLAGQLGIPAVICGYKLPDEAAETLFDDLPVSCSMLVVAVQSLLDLISNEDILKLPAPASHSELLAKIRLLLQTAHQADRFLRPMRPPEEREVIERAKRRLMEERGIGEEEAHRLLQRKSMNSGARLFRVAQMILDGDFTA